MYFDFLLVLVTQSSFIFTSSSLLHSGTYKLIKTVQQTVMCRSELYKLRQENMKMLRWGCWNLSGDTRKKQHVLQCKLNTYSLNSLEHLKVSSGCLLLIVLQLYTTVFRNTPQMRCLYFVMDCIPSKQHKHTILAKHLTKRSLYGLKC